MLAINLDIGDVILEDSWDVNLCDQTISMPFLHVFPSRSVLPELNAAIVEESIGTSARPRKTVVLVESKGIELRAYLWESSLGEYAAVRLASVLTMESIAAQRKVG